MDQIPTRQPYAAHQVTGLLNLIDWKRIPASATGCPGQCHNGCYLDEKGECHKCEVCEGTGRIFRPAGIKCELPEYAHRADSF